MVNAFKAPRLVLKLIYKLLCTLLVILVIEMTIVMFLQIAMRTLGIQSFKWSEEILRYSYIWVIFLGLPVAIYSNDLTRFDMIQKKLPPMANKVLETFLIIAMMIVLVLITKGSFKLIRVQMSQMATSINIPMGIIYTIMPVSACSSIVFFAIKLLLLWTKQPDLDEEVPQI